MDVKNKLFGYFAQRHFDLMSPEIRARFDEYAKNEDFQGHMKHWNDNYKGAMTPDLVNDFIGSTNEYKLTNDEWGDLYDAYQDALQSMDVAKIPPIGFDSEYKKATKDFIAAWFGNFADGKVFIQKTATGFADDILATGTHNLADFLTTNPAFKDIFKRNLADTFSDISYGDFIDGLSTQRYNSDVKFKEKVLAVIGYIRDYGPQPGYQTPPRSQWPQNVGYTAVAVGDGTFYVDAGSMNPLLTNIYAHSDTDTWFEIPAAQRTTCIQRFKDHYTEIFDTLLTKPKVREHFLAQTRNPIITEPLTKAIEATDYENKDSKDYVPEKYPDEKNWKQRLDDWKNDTYEDYFRKFVNPSRGTRLFFSPWSQNIIKAFDKVKIKPTDGLEGILSKKSEILDKLKSSKTSTDHFEWFTKTIENLKTAGMGKAVEGALRNGTQMRHLVSGLIAEAVEQGKTKEAKTALEILSVAKYGLSSSRTLNALHAATKDMKVFSDEKLSWNKNQGVAMVSKAIDKTAGLAIQGVGLAATGIRNMVSHSRTKINGDIRTNKILNKAHKHWNEEDKIAELDKLPNILADLSAGHSESHHIINATTIAAERTILAGMPNGPEKQALQRDISLYDKTVLNQLNEPAERANILARQTARSVGTDPYKELVAYWNMLETVGKTHSFTLGSMSVKRKAMLEGYTRDTSQAQAIARDYLNNFSSWRA